MKLVRIICACCLILFSGIIVGQSLSCEDAELLCSLNELDNFESSMPQSNPNDEPVPLCPGSGGGNPQNMTWFAFIAGSTSAVLELTFTNCQNGNRVQYGVYEDCSFANYVDGACQGNETPVNMPITVTIDNMIPGDDYFFFIDGDLGTYCDYSIDVISGGDPLPVPQPTEINCISANCPDDGNVCSTGETFTFEPDIDLTIDYIWTITPSPPNGATINGNNEFSATFNTPGTYEICVVADNGCTMTDEICYTLNVLEADAGELSADPETLCPGGTSTVTATGYVESSPLIQTMIAVGPDGTVINVIESNVIDVSLDVCGEVTVYSYNYNPSDAPAPPAIGDAYTPPNCTTSCCDIESIVVSFEDDEMPMLSNAPADITLECSDPIPDIEPVTWTDNCDGTGTVDGTQEDNYNVCTGGTITRTWSYTDGCMNETEYSQVITINAQEGGSFDSEPEDMTFDCVADIPAPIDLTWTGDCEGTFLVSPVDDGSSDLCNGGTRTRTWSYNDPCGGFTEYVQTFTINPANSGSYENEPGEITVLCDLSDLPPIVDLTWTGDCVGTAVVSGTESQDIDACTGGLITRTWTYVDACNVTSTHVQNIIVSPPPAPLPINPPPADITLNCDEIPDTYPDLDFGNGQSGNCEIFGTAEAEIIGDPSICGGNFTVLWLYTDQCFVPHNFVQEVTVNPAPSPEYIDPPADMTISCVETFPVPGDLDYTNNATGDCELSGTITPQTNQQGDICGGDVVAIWEFIDECGEVVSYTQTIIVEPIPEPEFVDPPQDVTIDCGDTAPSPINLSYTNNETGFCEIMGDVAPSEDGTPDVCGGEIIYMWEFTDDCNRTIEHTQTITINPAPQAEFIDPPANETIGCNDIPPSPPSLSYTNNLTGTCEIAGDQPPTTIDNSNSCGGNIVYNWSFTDPCGREILHSQTITITQAPMAEFTTMPADITVTCDNIPAPAGPLNYTNNDPCEIMGSVNPTIVDDYDICGGSITNTWEFTDECGRLLDYTQTITVEAAPIAEFVDVPANTTVACGANATNPGNLSYTNNGSTGCTIAGEVPPVQSGTYDACGGDILFTWEFTDECNRLIQHVQTVVVEPAPAAEFINLPVDITVSCADFSPTPPPLSYTNSEVGLCLISGNVPGTLVGSTSPCGVDVMYRWVFTDDCGRNITYTQNVTVLEAPMAAYISPPADITINCSEVPTSNPTLSYSNNASGICTISGNSIGIRSGQFDECGGDLTYSWTFTDLCNRTITHSQNVMVNPAPDPIFINTPADLTLNCGEDFPSDQPLDYTNSLTNDCEIAGTVISTSSSNGNITSYTWEFTNPCNNELITYTQNITGVPTPDISIDPLTATICLGEEFDLSSISVIDANGNPFTLTYTDGGAPFSDPIVSPTDNTTYTIIATNDAGCTDEATFLLNIDQPSVAGEANPGQVCSQGGLTYSLFDYLSGSYTPGGTWFDTDLSGANIDNPTNASFTGVDPGFYTFTYTIFSSNACPNAEVAVEIEVISEIEFEIFSVQCDPGGATYSINVISNGNNIFSNPGDVTVIDDNNVIIENIPAGANTIVSAIDENAFCISDQFVGAPDCDCPTIEQPISGGDFSICQGEPIPELSVTVNAGLTANWYDDQASTTPLIENSLTYTPIDSDPGTYNYYVEAVDSDGCVSLLRTLITLTINASPQVTNITAPVCVDGDGNATLDLQSLNLNVNSNASFTFTYYPTLNDAENETNPLDNTYVSTTNQTIYAVVTNSTGCSNIAEVFIEVNPLPAYTLEVMNEVCLGDMNGTISIVNIVPPGTSFSLDNITFDVVTSFDNLSPSTYTLYAMSPTGCLSSTPFTINNGLELSYTDLVIECDDNNTSSNSDDDFYTISFTIANTIGATGNVNVSSTTSDLGEFPYGAISVTILSGTAEVITITDIDSGCTIDFVTGDLNPCSTSCTIEIITLEEECMGNGTDADPNDDFYIITINATAVNGASNNTFNVTVDGDVVANFEYGVGGTINIPAQGQTAVIGVVDNADNQCFASQSIGPLDPCSNTCIISIDNQNFLCDNEGTIGIPGDDTYTFSFNILSTNSTSTTFDLFVDNVYVGTFEYGVLSEYTMPADGQTHLIQFVDSNDSSCTVELTSPELISCSGMCSLNVQIQDVSCDNQNTGTDETDDQYTADIFINIVGGTGSWVIAETSQTGSAGETVTVGPFPISGGDVVLTISDASISDCTETITITAPPTCSSCDDTVEAGADQALDCDTPEVTLVGSSSSGIVGTWTGPGGIDQTGTDLLVTAGGTYFYAVDFGEGCILNDSVVVTQTLITLVSNSFECDNQGTTGEPSDDTYTFSFTAENTNPNATSFNLLLDGSIVGTYTYGEASEYEIPADGSILTFEFIDTENSSCIVEIISPELTDCSGECTLTTQVSNVLCNNEMTTDDSLDDTFTAEITITTTGGSPNWIIEETGQTGISGEVVTVGPYLISNGPVQLNINNADVTDCEATILLLTPPPCSECNESVEAGADWILDCTVKEANLVGTVSSSTVGTWTGPGGFSVNSNETTVEVPGTYYFTADFGNGCIRTDSLMVSVSNDIPIANAGINQDITCARDSVILVGSVTGGSGNFSYQWLDATMTEISTDLSIVVRDIGNYFFVVYDIDTDCTSPPSVVEVIDNTADLVPLINAQPGAILDCFIDAITLTTENLPNVEYKWFINNVLISGTTLEITITDAAVVNLEAINLLTGCSGMAELVVTDLEEYPIVSIETPAILDCTNDMITLDGSSSQTGSSISYTWLDDEGMVITTGPSTLDIQEGGTYYLQLIDEDNGCTNIDTVEVDSNIDRPEIMLDDAATIDCDETSLDIALIADNPDALVISWQTLDGNILSGSDLPEVMVGGAGTYLVSVINPNNDCETIDSIVVSLPVQIEDANLSIQDESCEESNNGTVTVNSVQGGESPFTYFLEGVEFTSDMIGELDEGTYVLQVVDANGCTFETQVLIEQQEIFEIDLLSEITLTQGQSTVLKATVNLDPSEIETIVWLPAAGLSCNDCLSPTLTAGISDVEYTVGITDIYGCYAEATIVLRADEDIIISIPNIFSPNDSGVNDDFTVYTTVDATINTFQIFDRWGNLVFNKESIPTNDPSLGWDGKFENTDVVPGVYVYFIELSIDGKIETRGGDITVIR